MTDRKNITSQKKCKVEGCQGKHYAKGLCQKHRSQIQKHGFISRRTYREPNEITIIDDYCILDIYDKDCEVIAKAIFDVDDISLVSSFKWALSRRKKYAQYVCSMTGGKRTMLHRLVMGVTGRDIQIDHINRNPLDNRKANLRICNASQNKANSPVTIANISGHKGVSFCKALGKWGAGIKKNGKSKHIGYFDTPEAAAIAYNVKAKEMFGEFAYLNEVVSGA